MMFKSNNPESRAYEPPKTAESSASTLEESKGKSIVVDVKSSPI